jgi:hypothetical protein
MATFDLPWVAASRFSIKYKTDIDSEYTAHEQRNALKSNPQYRWSVLVPRSPANFAALQAFFEARKGRWNAFNFVWATDRGGNGTTYLVRFDTPDDELVFTSDDAHWVIPLVQVVN